MSHYVLKEILYLAMAEFILEADARLYYSPLFNALLLTTAEKGQTLKSLFCFRYSQYKRKEKGEGKGEKKK